MNLSRRDLLVLSGITLCGGTVAPSLARAQTPKRGGTLTIRRIFDVAKRREVIHELQRYLARQQYYVHPPSGVYVAVWEGALKNYGPNLGYDYGGRLMAAWLDR